MNADPSDTLPPEAELALAWSRPEVRGTLMAALHLDRRLGRIVARTREPMLGQMRLAWWREALGKPVAERPRGDAVLDAIGVHWCGREAALVNLVDAWEIFVTTKALGPKEAVSFGEGRGAFFGAMAVTGDAAIVQRLAAAGFRWALADAATAISDAEERAAVIGAGLSCGGTTGRMPASFRGLAVLDALASRALRRGGMPLMEGRMAPLTALRAAIFRA